MTSSSELKKQAEVLKEEKQKVQEDLSEWKKKLQNLEDESKKLIDEMKKDLDKKDEVIDELCSANEELKSYIDCLTKSEGIAYRGKSISAVKKKSRTLKCFLSRARTALWFAESFGLDVSSINVKEKTTGIEHAVSFAVSSSTSTGGDMPEDLEREKQHGFDALSQDDKEKVEEILFLLDKFYVSDEFYHEITMLDGTLPRSYLIKQRCDQLNKICSISRLPGDFDGCQIDFEDTLIKCLEHFISENPDFDFTNNSVKIKFSGDGAQMTRNTNFVFLTLAVLDSKKKNPMSARGNHSLAVVKASEDYEVLKGAFGNIFDRINTLNREKHIRVGEKIINLELFFGGDYKFLLMVLGLQNATCNHACIWCKVHKDGRWNMSHDHRHFNEGPLRRTMKEIKEMASKSKNNYCCVRQPLVEIDLDHIVLDELHLMLRVVDVLMDNLIARRCFRME